ncbi:glycosyltransferase family 1 protein [Saccharata proteae CBS 121410]|uniref:Glycosyltransferase family 1 protein n=1 Tax=Saccharata proteae CBS 121410 TaxID=1314787 RepID=A0A9P4I2H6_9PEZI|nr:glycosyltransferase family 1 protein [Saccharata proteae CBS 121410]
MADLGMPRDQTSPVFIDKDGSTLFPSTASDSDSSSSSSSSDEEDERTQKRGHKAEQQKAQGRKNRRESSSDPYKRFKVGNEQFKTKGKVSRRDGRLKISVNEATNNGYLAKALGSGVKHHFQASRHEGALEEESVPIAEQEASDERQHIDDDLFREDNSQKPKLNIVIMVIGSRGDIQPFIKIGKILQNDYGHRVRIATHPAFKKFVAEDSGLEFFSVGGNPSELMAFMVKNPGLIPSMETVKKGEIGRRRSQMFEMFQGMWRACINATDDEHDKDNSRMMGEKNPFVADAIIANPPSFAHIHIAERLGIPLHMMFTFPYTPTSMFPHPLANIKKSNVDANYSNFMSYPLVEMMTWQGLGDLVNKFRVKTLGLEPVNTLWAPGQLYRLKVPYTYMWSPTLVPKPADWGPEVDIGGFVFLELASSFEPPDGLTKFLDAGPPPIYIGFGSIVVDDPDNFTKMIFEAVKEAGVRALVSKGWGGIGGGDTPDNIYLLDNTPHDWLFPKVSAVVHHGGAGTTAMGLKCGKPTMIVPFFGDQPFWGAMVAEAKAGAHQCIPYKQLTMERLAEGIKQCLSDEAKENVAKIAKSIEKEGDGAQNAVKSFHRSLPLRGDRSLRCSILEDRVAAWRLKNTSLRLSPLAAELLFEQRKIKWQELRLIRHYEWNDFEGPGEPITGVGTAVTGTLFNTAAGVGSVPKNLIKSIRKREKHEKKKREKAERQEKRRTQVEKANAAEGIEKDATDGQTGPNGNSNEPSEPHDGDQNGRPKASRNATSGTLSTQMSLDPSETLPEELFQQAGEGFGQTGIALAKAPMDLALALAQGFHNAPRLYGDSDVRRPVRISGFYSGLRASRDEFLYGIYDGWTGLVTQPYRGARDGGVFGCVKGVGIGIGGFVLKDVSAIVGPFGYTMKGIHKEMLKKSQPTHFIRKARIVQGRNDKTELDRNCQKDPEHCESVKVTTEKVVRGWDIVQEVLTFEQHRARNSLGGLGGSIETGATDNVATAEKALKARKRGESLEDAMKDEKKRVERANEPRQAVMDGGARKEKKGTEMENGRVLSDAGEVAGDEGGKGGGIRDSGMGDSAVSNEGNRTETAA